MELFEDVSMQFGDLVITPEILEKFRMSHNKKIILQKLEKGKLTEQEALQALILYVIPFSVLQQYKSGPLVMGASLTVLKPEENEGHFQYHVRMGIITGQIYSVHCEESLPYVRSLSCNQSALEFNDGKLLSLRIQFYRWD